MSGSISDNDWEITGSLNEVDSSDDCDLRDSSSEDRAVDDWELTESSNDVMVRQDGNDKSATDNNSPKGEVFDDKASTCEVQKTDKVLVAENVAHMKEGLPKLEDQKVQVDEEEKQVESFADSYKQEIPKVEDNLFRWNEEELEEIIDMFEQRLEETTLQCSAEAEDQARFSNGYSTQELQKVEEKTETVEQLHRESMLRLEQLLAEEWVARLKAEGSLVASVTKRRADIDEQVEHLKGHSKQEIKKVEEKTEMVEQRLKETISRLEQQLAEEHAARLKTEDALEAALMRCTTETEEQLESLQAYSKQEIGKVEGKIMMIAQATLELDQRLEDEQTAYYKGIDSVEKDILGLDVDIGSLERRLDKIEKDKEEEVETYRSNGEKFKELIEKVEQRFRETTLRLELQLAEEKAARMRSEVLLQEAQTDSSNEICKLKESLAKAEKETEVLRKEAKSPQGVVNEFSAPSPTPVRSSVARRGFHEVHVKRISRNFSGSYCSYTSSDIVVPVRPHNIENHWWI